MRRLLLAGVLLLLPAAVQAQTNTGVQLVISGGVSPVTNVLPIGSIVCGQTASPPGGTVLNPKNFEYKNVPTDTTVCRYTDPGNGPLLSLPFGGTTYTATVAFVNAVGVGPVSNVSNPFSRPGTVPTVAPVSLQVGP